MSVRAKMNLTSITEEKYGPQDGNSTKYLNFSCQYDMTIPEDQRFQKSTPALRDVPAENPDALAPFIPGQAYYVDFTPVPKS